MNLSSWINKAHYFSFYSPCLSTQNFFWPIVIKFTCLMLTLVTRNQPNALPNCRCSTIAWPLNRCVCVCVGCDHFLVICFFLNLSVALFNSFALRFSLFCHIFSIVVPKIFTHNLLYAECFEWPKICAAFTLSLDFLCITMSIEFSLSLYYEKNLKLLHFKAACFFVCRFTFFLKLFLV